jgi:plastocyanin
MRSTHKLLVSAATAALAVTAAIPAIAAGTHKGGGGHKSAKLTIMGGTSVKVNKYEKDSVHWVPGTVAISSGGTLTIANKSPDRDPHTFSIVQKSQRPHTLSQIESCAVCGEIAHAHGASPEEHSSGPPPIVTVDPKKDGFNEPGDSQFIAPHQTLTLTITAKPGTKLYFMCAIHPWMQGVVKVIK